MTQQDILGGNPLHEIVEAGLLVPAQFENNKSGKLYTITDISNVLVRHEDMHGERDENIARMMISAQDTFTALPKHGVHVGPYIPAKIGTSIYSATYVVEGTAMQDALRTQPEIIAPKADDLFKNLGTFLLDKYVKGQEFASDIFGMHQYMYGTTPADASPELRLVDLDALVNNIRYPGRFTSYVIDLANEVVTAEDISASAMPKSRKIIEELLPIESSSRHENIPRFKELGNHILKTGQVFTIHDELFYGEISEDEFDKILSNKF